MPRPLASLPYPVLLIAPKAQTAGYPSPLPIHVALDPAARAAYASLLLADARIMKEINRAASVLHRYWEARGRGERCPELASEAAAASETLTRLWERRRFILAGKAFLEEQAARRLVGAIRNRHVIRDENRG